MEFEIKTFETEFLKIKHEVVLQSEYQEKVSKLSKLVNKALYWAEDVYTNQQTTDNYIEKYQPISI